MKDQTINSGPMPASLGLDMGSTTIKAVLLSKEGLPIFTRYVRHFSNIRESVANLLQELDPLLPGPVPTCMTGSGGISLASELGIDFIQEVLACTIAIGARIPDADTVIELGGEDAKITYLSGGIEQRMNETCAGGTGAFLDQMAAFIGTDAAGLDQLAANAHTIYPIASRCGVFAKSDILPLLNEGCRKEDIAASIMQAVVAQTIGGLAQGRPISGKVVFLGGPLHFIHTLRERFQTSLPDLKAAVFPEDAHNFVALGAALHVLHNGGSLLDIPRAIDHLRTTPSVESATPLKPLFPNAGDLAPFRERHAKADLPRGNLETASGKAWLGFDCGSTTIKAVLLGEDGVLLHTRYEANRGDPLKIALDILSDIYKRKNPALRIAGSAATGYGSAMLAAALHLDIDEVETVAHATAAAHFDPHVSFILDIGGQDIKCMHIKKGVIHRISLNEACSAGCGSFIENFASSLGLDLRDFVAQALAAPNPVDLGTRCTVFMNSKVKQAQKEGAAIGDIAAGLAFSVIRNAIFKVMKIANPSELGKNILVQGGAFHNDALLRAIELELGLQVTRPAISGLMGAFGAALMAKKRVRGKSSILPPEELHNFSVKAKTTRCKGCANNCLLTVSTFRGTDRFITGNRCERGSGIAPKKLPNLVDWKYRELFDRQPLPIENAPCGAIGIPRVLNIYENYPLWFGLLTALGFRVELSPPSSKELYFSGFDTIPSQTVCYPAKLVHGHIRALCKMGLKNIFFPCVQHEQEDADFHHGTYNCPVVSGYPELIALNMPDLEKYGVTLFHDFLPLDRTLLARRLGETEFFRKFSPKELENAVNVGFEAMEEYRAKLRRAGEAALEELDRTHQPGLILAGHPYHADPAIHHGISDLINSCGLGVLTEDSIAHLMPDAGPLRVVDQWAYHSRLYRAGAFTAKRKNLAILQLVSFGCGLDAITSDQLEEIVMARGSLYAQIKIDEGANLGPARIRVRSLLAAMRESWPENGNSICRMAAADHVSREWPVFREEMKATHKLLVPQMSPLHFQFTREIFASAGYDAVLLPHVGREAIELGLRHVNNDACYPAIVVIGQLLEAIRSGKFATDRIALVISQTGGGCRATNYIAFLRKALLNAGLGHIPIANFSTRIDSPGIRMTMKMLGRMIMAGHYGDALMRTLHRLRPYELEEGATQALVEKWSRKGRENIESGSLWRFQRNMFQMIGEFDKLPLKEIPRRPRIGLVGEILLKYHPEANNHAARIIEEEGGEAVVTDIMDFFLYCMYDHIFNYEHLAGSGKNSFLARVGIAWQELTRTSLRLALKASKRFTRPARFDDLRAQAAKLISLGHQTGEGWLLGAEMLRMLEGGVSGILCIQPFGCLPNHIVGKGLIRELKGRYPHAAIMALDYDPGASEVNQINRIKLMMRSGMKDIREA